MMGNVRWKTDRILRISDISGKHNEIEFLQI